MSIEVLGTKYGGWHVPKNMNLNENSVCYLVGVGEDISFYVSLVDKYNCNVVLIDPTQRAIIHFNEYKQFLKTGLFKFSGNIQPDYKQHIVNKSVDINKFNYINIGLWNTKTTLKFYKQTNPEYVSQSLVSNMFSQNYDEVKVNTLKNIMIENNHDRIDLLKIDIEGAEIEVLENMLSDNIYPTYLCVEFDLKLKGKDLTNKTDVIIRKLINIGYKIICNVNHNITFKMVVS
jgi:FkbM family methyltransferase